MSHHVHCPCVEMLSEALREMREHPHMAMAIAKAALDALDKSSCHHPLAIGSTKPTTRSAKSPGADREVVAGINSHYDGDTK